MGSVLPSEAYLILPLHAEACGCLGALMCACTALRSSSGRREDENQDEEPGEDGHRWCVGHLLIVRIKAAFRPQPTP